MSRVLKSAKLTVSFPKLINCLHDNSGDKASINSVMIKNSEIEEENSRAEEVARDILSETEEMVKQLMATARAEAEKILKEAREKHENIIIEAEKEANRLKDEAYNQGYHMGFAEGRKKAELKCQSMEHEAMELLEKARHEKEKIILSAEKEIIKLSVAIAEKIIHQELAVNPDIIISIVREALKKISDRENVNLNVNPENIDAVLNKRDELQQSTVGIKNMKILADPTVNPGGCVIETSNGNVDARLERQLDEIEQALMEVSPGD